MSKSKLKKKLGSLRLEFLLLPLVLLLALGFNMTPLGEEMENLTLDWRFKARGPSDPAAAPQVLMVGIDEDSLAKLGRWPWSRQTHAELLTLLGSRPPAAVVFDLLFTEPSADPALDQMLADAMIQTSAPIIGAMAEALPKVQKFDAENIGNTMAIASFEGDIRLLVGNDTVLLPVKVLGENSHAGMVNAPPGPDGVRRQLPLVVRCGSRVFPSLVLQSLLTYEGVESDAVTVSLGNCIHVKGKKQTWAIPIDEHGQMTINYRHPDTFKDFPFARLAGRLMQYNKDKEWPKEDPPITGQVLFIGQTAAGLADLGPTPHSSHTSLVLTHANALSNILSGDYIKKPDFWQFVGFWALAALLTVLLVRFAPIWLAVLFPLLVIGGYGFAAFHFFKLESLHLPVAWPVLGFMVLEGSSMLHRLVLESKAKSRITGIFGTFLAPTVVKQLIASGEEPQLGGHEAEITAFFSDIAGFSSFSEKLTPERLVNLMNDYLSEMADILQDNGGCLDKFIGDAIVGMFNAPLSIVGHAHSACCAALLVQKRQLELREKWRKEGDWPEIVYEMKTRIGLNSGPAIVGLMGSSRRKNYTMMGDTVNLAARSESGAKSYGVYTMITGETKSLAEQHKDDIAFRYLDKIVVKGRTLPAEVYEVVGFKNELSAQTIECLSLFQQGIERYLAQDWDGAKTLFQSSAKLEIHQDDNPSLIMLKRCDALKASPPPADWDGVYVMKSK